MNVQIQMLADQVLPVQTLRAVIAAIALMVLMGMPGHPKDASIMMNVLVRHVVVMLYAQILRVVLNVYVQTDEVEIQWMHAKILMNVQHYKIHVLHMQYAKILHPVINVNVCKVLRENQTLRCYANRSM